MPKVNLELGNGTYEDYSLTVSSQQCTNMFPVYPTTGGYTEAVLYNSPGIISRLDLGSSEKGRGQIEFQDKMYTVSGRTLYRIDRKSLGGTITYVQTDVGTIQGSGHVWLAKNSTQICIVVPGVIAYIYTEDNGVVEIRDANFKSFSDTYGAPLAVVYINSYFVFTNPEIIFQSEPNNGLEYDATKFGTAEMDPDKIVAPFVFRNQLYVFGTDLTEIYDDVGGNGFTFIREQGYVLDKGLASPFAVVECEESFMFMGGSASESHAIWRVEKNTPTKMSTSAIDRVIQKYSADDVLSAFATTYSISGAHFTVFTLPSDTYVFDIYATRAAQRAIWHKLETRVGTVNDRWHVHDITKVYNRHMTTDHFTGIVGEISIDEFQEQGNPITRTFSSATLNFSNYPMIVDSLEVTLETGTSPDNVPALLTLSVSRDGGKTWEHQQVGSAGVRGDNAIRIIWYSLGWFERFFNIRLQWSANAKMVISKVESNIRSKGVQTQNG